MQQRELQDDENTTWACVEVFAGLVGGAADIPRAKEEADTVTVVCTPRGGARSRRVELPTDWFSALSDEQLIARIQAAA